MAETQAEGGDLEELEQANAQLLAVKEAGEHISCDARSGNWVRLREKFVLRGRSAEVLRIVLNAPDDLSPHTKKLSVKKTMKTMPGKRL